LEPEFFGAIDVESGRSILFMPKYPIEYGTWLGNIETPEECRER
jgi:Xaa-Pro dipeptidase